MTSHVQFTPEARADLHQIARWYERQRKDLGRRFIGEVRSSVSLLTAHPHAFPVVHRTMRRALVKDFPYGVFYIEENSVLVITGVIGLKRQPKVWRSRAR